MGEQNLETDEALKASREANALLLNCIAAMSAAIMARDKYIEFLTSSGRFTMADVHASDSLADDVIAKTGVAYGLVPIKEMIPNKYQHLFGTHLQTPAKRDDSAAGQPACDPSKDKPKPQQQQKKVEMPGAQDVSSEAFNAAEITLKFVYDNRATAAEFSRSTTAAVLSWYNTYLTTVINKIRSSKLPSYSEDIGVTNELLMRDGFIENLKQYTRTFANQTNVKVRLIMPDGTSSLIVPMTGIT